MKVQRVTILFKIKCVVVFVFCRRFDKFRDKNNCWVSKFKLKFIFVTDSSHRPGDFHDDLFHGNGIYTSVSGDVYTGA